MFTWNHILAQQARYEDLRREAERRRLVLQALAARPRQQRFWYRVMNRLGRRMVRWGQRLQQRYSATAGAHFLTCTDG